MIRGPCTVGGQHVPLLELRRGLRHVLRGRLQQVAPRQVRVGARRGRVLGRMRGALGGKLARLACGPSRRQSDSGACMQGLLYGVGLANVTKHIPHMA